MPTRKTSPTAALDAMRRAVTAPVKVGKAPATVAVAAEVAEVDVVDAARALTEVSARIARREPVLIRKQQPWVPKATPMPTRGHANRAMTPSVSRAKHVKHVKHARAVARAMQNVVVNVASAVSVVAEAATANARRALTTPMQTAMFNVTSSATPSAMLDATKAARHAKHAPLTRPTHRQKPTHC